MRSPQCVFSHYSFVARFEGGPFKARVEFAEVLEWFQTCAVLIWMGPWRVSSSPWTQCW